MKKAISLLIALVLLLLPTLCLAGNSILSIGAVGTQLTVVTDSVVMGVTIGPPTNVLSEVVSVTSRSDGTLLWVLSPTGQSEGALIYYTLDGSSWEASEFHTTLKGGTGSSSGSSPSQPDETPWPSASFQPYSIGGMEAGSNGRTQSRLGPAKSYCGGGGFKPYKVTSLCALFNEDGYIFVDMDYSTVGRRRLYFSKNSLYGISSSLPSKQWQGYPAVTTANITPSFGPGNHYDQFESAPLPSGSWITVFFSEDSYVFAEFTTTVSDTKSTRVETIRCYLPEDLVEPQ